jgi:hypothetical protein
MSVSVYVLFWLCAHISALLPFVSCTPCPIIHEVSNIQLTLLLSHIISNMAKYSSQNSFSHSLNLRVSTRETKSKICLCKQEWKILREFREYIRDFPNLVFGFCLPSFQLCSCSWNPPVTVAERSKACTVFARSEAGIVGSIFGMCMCLCCSVFR